MIKLDKSDIFDTLDDLRKAHQSGEEKVTRSDAALALGELYGRDMGVDRDTAYDLLEEWETIREFIFPDKV